MGARLISPALAPRTRLALWVMLTLLVWGPAVLSNTAWAHTQAGAAAQAPAASRPAELADADLPLGEQLIRQHRCAECHIRRVGGDGSAIYKPQGRIQNAGSLITMVQRCSTELNLSLFPDEVTAIAAVLHRDHYRFK